MDEQLLYLRGCWFVGCDLSMSYIPTLRNQQRLKQGSFLFTMQSLTDFQNQMPHFNHNTIESFPLWLGSVSESQLPTQYWLRLLKEHLLYLQKREQDFNTRQSYFFRQVMIDRMLER